MEICYNCKQRGCSRCRNDLKRSLRFLLDDVRLSVKALASLRSQLALAMLLALSVVLSYFGGFYLTQDNKIATSFLAMALAGYLYGPVPAALVGALTDLIQYILRPAGPFFPGYMISGVVNGFLYGFCLYRREGRGLMAGIPVSKLLVNVLVNIGLNTLWLHLLYGTPYLVLLAAARAEKRAALPGGGGAALRGHPLRRQKQGPPASR